MLIGSCPLGETRVMKWIRPAIALLGSLAVMVAFLMGKVSSEAFMGFITATVIFWFKSRDEEKPPKT